MPIPFSPAILHRPVLTEDQPIEPEGSGAGEVGAIGPPPEIPPPPPPPVPIIPLGPPPEPPPQTPPPPPPEQPPQQPPPPEVPLPPPGVGITPIPPEQPPPLPPEHPIGPPPVVLSPIPRPPSPREPSPTEPQPLPAPGRISVPPVIVFPPVGVPPVGGPTTPPPEIGGAGPPTLVEAPPISSGSTGGVGNVTVIVNNLETIGADVVTTIADAIEAGLANVEVPFANAVTSLTDGIRNALGSLASNIAGFLKDALASIASHIGDILSTIAAKLGDIVKQIADAIAPILKDIADAVKTVFKDLYNLLDTVLSNLNYYLTKYVIPITNAIRRTFTVVQNLIATLHRDLHQGILGLLSIPNAIADAESALYGTFDRLWEQIRPGLKDDTQSNIKFGAEVYGGLIGQSISDSISKTLKVTQQLTTYSAADNLNDPTLGSISGSVVECLRQLSTQVFSTIAGVLQEQYAKWQAGEAIGDTIVNTILQEFFVLFTQVIATFAAIYPLYEYGRQVANKCVPISTLGPSEIVEARIRSFIDDNTYNEELRRQGVDSTRAKLLLDLGKQRLSVSDLIDFNVRGIVADSDFQAGLTDLGYTTTQIKAIQEAIPRLATVDEVLLWLKRGVIAPDTATVLIQQLRYREEHTQAILNTYKTPVGARFRSDLQGVLDASQTGWLQDTLLNPVPQEVVDAGLKEGLEEGYVRLLWLNHWQLPPYNQIVVSYFRGFRTYTEVVAAMISQNIPREVHNELVENSRPLIPYRSIPSFVKAGAMSLADATVELTRHGFDQQHINWIEKLLTATKTTTATKAAATAHTVSVATARTLFDDGAITKDQYEAILVEHGYSADIAKTTADVEEIAAHTKQRKALLADALAEVSAGVVTLDSATSTLVAAGLTEAELAKFHLAAAKALRLNAKHPSISELDKFAKAKLITQTQYRTELQAQGWAAPWLDAFAGLLYSSPQADFPG